MLKWKSDRILGINKNPDLYFSVFTAKFFCKF
jgi:hypothetical protein